MELRGAKYTAQPGEYQTYKNRLYCRENLFYSRRHAEKRYCYPCPGHGFHKLPHKPFKMFNRWYRIGERSHYNRQRLYGKVYGLYWRTHA